MARFVRRRDLKAEIKVAYLSCFFEPPELAQKPPKGAVIVGYFWVSGYLRSRSYPQMRDLTTGLQLNQETGRRVKCTYCSLKYSYTSGSYPIICGYVSIMVSYKFKRWSVRSAERENSGSTYSWQEFKHIKVWEHAVPDNDLGQLDGWLLESKVVLSDVRLQFFF